MPWLLVILVAAAARAQSPCASCHPLEAEKHAATNHARTLRPAGETEFARMLPDRPIGEARGGFLLQYQRSGSGVLVKAERGKEAAEGRMEWAIGAGDQGVTPLISYAGRWLEHRISLYTKPVRFDLTLGHAPGASRSAAAALGVAQPEQTIRTCLGCHGRLSADGSRVEEAGVQCERCHAGAAEHAKTRAAVGNPGKTAAKAQVRLCAECHRLDAPGSPDDPLNIRFQPLRLARSACYVKGEAGCVTCHTAHENAVRNDAGFYRAKCQGCHQSEHTRAGRDWLPCHMPKLSPAPYLEFTDHYIRIARRGR